jgi:putative ABC transport system permease protein
MLLVRTAGEPTAILPAVRQEMRALNPQLPLFETGTLSASLAETLTPPRFRAVLLTGFAALAVALATIGIYGVTAYAVSQRTHEVGIRMALGAGAGSVLSLMLGQHLRPAAIGVGLGIAGAIALSQSLRGLLYGVSLTDPFTFGLMAVVLLGVAAVACWIPARRATKVDPLVALRAE